MIEIISRSDAKAKGLRRYFTGKPCIHGHMSERYVGRGTCLTCNSEHLKNNRETHQKSRAAWRRNNPERAKIIEHRSWLKRQYGLTLEDRDRMSAAQDHKCAGCLQPFIDTPRIDHCHATGKIRGLLCHGCNVALGLVKEDVETLARLAAYLSVSSGR